MLFRRPMFRRLLLVAFLLMLLVLLIFGLGLYWVYRATQQVPEFYQRALQAEPVRQAAASDQMIERSTALASDVKRPGKWRALVVREQVAPVVPRAIELASLTPSLQAYDRLLESEVADVG